MNKEGWTLTHHRYYYKHCGWVLKYIPESRIAIGHDNLKWGELEYGQQEDEEEFLDYTGNAFKYRVGLTTSHPRSKFRQLLQSVCPETTKRLQPPGRSVLFRVELFRNTDGFLVLRPEDGLCWYT